VSRLLVGVAGSVAAYKAVEVVRLAVRAGHAVRVIQSPNGARFVGPATFAAITGAPVLADEFAEDPARGAYPGEPQLPRAPITHLALAQRADAYLIAPASAATIAGAIR
jgi:phosphopantothenoylcysteine decarboxylase/phosphopantothenate--cysteine ligase